MHTATALHEWSALYYATMAEERVGYICALESSSFHQLFLTPVISIILQITLVIYHLSVYAVVHLLPHPY